MGRPHLAEIRKNPIYAISSKIIADPVQHTNTSGRAAIVGLQRPFMAESGFIGDNCVDRVHVSGRPGGAARLRSLFVQMGHCEQNGLRLAGGQRRCTKRNIRGIMAEDYSSVRRIRLLEPTPNNTPPNPSHHDDRLYKAFERSGQRFCSSRANSPKSNHCSSWPRHKVHTRISECFLRRKGCSAHCRL